MSGQERDPRQPFTLDETADAKSDKKLHRLLRLVTLVQSGPGWSAKKLAHELGVDERTVFRYLKDLAQAGVNLTHDAATDGYRAAPGSLLPPMQLTGEEALALALLCDQVAGGQQIAHLTAAEDGLRKIRAQLPPQLAEELEAEAPSIRVQTAPATDADGWQKVYDDVRWAIRHSKALRCQYESGATSVSGQESPWFEFEPYALLYSVRAWYAVGLHRGRNAERTLKLSRFAAMQRTDRTFERHAEFSLETYLGNAWRMMKGTPEYDVAIWFDPEFTHTVSDTKWHKTQEFEFNEDGSCVLKCRVAGLEEIVWWVLGMGPHAKVLGPPELAQRVATLASRTAGQYGPM